MSLQGLKKQCEKLELEILDKDLKENINNSTKVNLKDKEGYLYFLSESNLFTINKRKNKPNRFFRNNLYTKQNIENYLKINNISIKLFSNESEITDAHKDLKFYCLIHKIEFFKSWNEIKNGAYCPECGMEKYKESRKNSYEDVKRAFEEKGFILISREYINNETPLEYICPKHKDKGILKTTWANFISKKYVCPYCANEVVGNSQRKSHEQFLEEVKKIHGNKYTILGRYIRTKDKVDVLCNECNTIFPITPAHLLEGHGCPNCNRSLGENRIKLYLDNNNIYYDIQYRIEQCRGIQKTLPFDFAVFKNKECTELMYLIEYQGEQHFKPVQFGNMSIEEAKEQFKIQQYSDNIKFLYCCNNNIKLIRIPYWDFNNIEKILDNHNKIIKVS